MATASQVERIRKAERLFDQKQFDEAASLAESVLRGDPGCAAAHQVLGLVLSERGKPREAVERLTRALALQGDLVPSHNGIGRCHFLLGELDQALRCFNRALRLQPEHAFAHFNRAMVRLRQGQFREGWIEYEWRWNCGLVSRPAIPRPRWDGSPLHGRSILVHTEQGLGDVLQFVRLLPLLKRQGGRVVLACQKAMQALLRPLTCVDDWFPVDEPGPITFDVYCPLLSLPGLLEIDEHSIPREVPYVPADAGRVERWRSRVESLPGLRVGLGWQGSPTFHGDRFRSIPLEHFAGLAGVPGVSFVSLQKGAGVEQIAANRERLGLTVFSDLDEEAPLMDTAAVMQHLDLVITSDTAIAHLAGALGRPCWVLLAIGCDWRWLDGRADSPWYPSLRLFRQRAFADWDSVFRDAAAALRVEAARKAQGSGQGPEGSPGDRGVLRVPVSAGELIDKITILEIKSEQARDEQRLANVRYELQELQSVRAAELPGSEELDLLVKALKEINQRLWDIEDEVRLCERAGDFGERFVALARSVYHVNAERSAVKRRINELLRSTIVEEKLYADTSRQDEARCGEKPGMGDKAEAALSG